jgi:hypothetical protein
MLGVDIETLRHKVSANLGSEAPPQPPTDRRVAINAGRMAIHQTTEVDLRDPAAPRPEPEPNPHACSFCDTELGHGDRFIAGATARICVECVRASARLLGAMDALTQDFTLRFDGTSRTATLSLGTAPVANGS